MPRRLDSSRLRQVANLSDLIAYLREELGWPVASDTVVARSPWSQAPGSRFFDSFE